MAVPLLTRCIYLYLALPYLLFFWGWLRVPYALLMTGALVLGVVLVWKQRGMCGEHSGPMESPSKGAVLPFLVLAIAWAAFSGIGGFGFQNPDYAKHHAVLRDLVQLEWPVGYGKEGETKRLVYYIAYYLPAAGAGKLLGWRAAHLTEFVWAVTGLFLVLHAVATLIGHRKIWAVFIFPFLSGMDYLGFLLFLGRSVDGTTHLEWWMRLDGLNEPSRVWQFSSNTTLLFWVPQMSIAGWLLASAVSMEVLHRKSARNLLFLLGLSLLWSPFLTLGLLPFVGVGLYRSRLKGLVSVQNAVSGTLLLVLGFFYFRSRSDFEGWHWIWKVDHLEKFWTSYALFVGLEFGLYAIFLRQEPENGKRQPRAWFWAAFATLCLAPLYSSGGSNDFAMRVAIVPLFVFWLSVLETLLDWRTPTHRLTARILGLLLAIGAITPLTEFSRSIWYGSSGIPPIEETRSVIDLPMAVQYLGEDKTFFFAHLARK